MGCYCLRLRLATFFLWVGLITLAVRLTFDCCCCLGLWIWSVGSAGPGNLDDISSKVRWLCTGCEVRAWCVSPSRKELVKFELVLIEWANELI